MTASVIAVVPTAACPSGAISAVRKPSASTRDTACSMTCAASSRLSDQRSRRAALRIAPIGLAMPLPAPASQLEGSHRNALDLRGAVAHRVDRGVTPRRRIAPFGFAEVKPSGQLADHEEIDVLDSLRAQC